MSELVTGDMLLKTYITKKDRILLINPPVFESRYSWLRWNQPLDLLKVGAFVQSEIGADVQLLDLMLPDAKGRVVRQARTGSQRYERVGHSQIPMWRFGKPFDEIHAWVRKQKKEGRSHLPTQVWITSLCSYWFESVEMMVLESRKALPGAQVVLCGQYPELMTSHATELSAADLLVHKRPHLPHQFPKLDLYDEKQPPFYAIDLEVEGAVRTVEHGVKQGVFHYAFFEEDICRSRGEPLEEILKTAGSIHRHVRFHAICGLQPQKVTRKIAKVLTSAALSELHFEEHSKAGRLEADGYEKALRYLRESAPRTSSIRTSGFVWMGRPGDKLEHLMQNAFTTLRYLDGLILKPYTPTPGSDVYRSHYEYLQKIEYVKLSPHFFPFAAKNGITIDEYHDMYRVAAFLNEKVRGRSFDFLKESKYGADLLKESLRREVWNLEGKAVEEEDRDYAENPLRVVD